MRQHVSIVKYYNLLTNKILTINSARPANNYKKKFYCVSRYVV